MVSAFPAELAGAVAAVLDIMPRTEFVPNWSFAVTVEGQQLSIPERVHNDEPPLPAVTALPPVQRRILHCLYSRHGDGLVRQRHLEKVIDSVDAWVAPFVVRLLGEYVVEIVDVVHEGLRDLAKPGRRREVYGRFVAENPQFFARTQRQAVSYWACYYHRRFPDFRDYPGSGVLDLLREAGSEQLGRPVPDHTPTAHRRRPRRGQ